MVAVSNPSVASSESTIAWYDAAKIAPDGTFEFASLPDEEFLQMHAICDGYITKNWDAGRLQFFAQVHGWKNWKKRNSRWPQVFSMVEEELSPTLNMEPSCTCKFVVKNADGTPAKNVVVGMWPNIVYFGRSGNIIGTALQSSGYARDGKIKYFRKWQTCKATDSNGVVLITGIPTGRHGFEVYDSDFVSILEENGEKTDEAAIAKPDIVTITNIVLMPRKKKKDK